MSRIFAALLGTLCLAGCGQPGTSSVEERPTIVPPPAAMPPLPPLEVVRLRLAMDGRTTEDDRLVDAPSAERKGLDDATRAALAGTVFRAVYTATALVLTATCPDRAGSQPPARSGKDPVRDRAPDPATDMVEFSIDPLNEGVSAYQICINRGGSLLDAQVSVHDFTDKAWNLPTQPVISRLAGGWEVRVEIPFTALGIEPAAGDALGLLAVRRLPAGPGKDIPAATLTWPATAGGRDMWSWWQRRKLPCPILGRSVVLGRDPGCLVTSWSRGEVLARPTHPEANTWRIMAVNPGAVPRSLAFEVVCRQAGKETTAPAKVLTVESGAAVPLALGYGPAGDVTEFRVRDTVSGSLLYRSLVRGTLDVPQRLLVPAGQSDPSLVVQVPQPAARAGFICWDQRLKMRQGALQYAAAIAIPFASESLVAGFAGDGFMPVMTVRHDELRYNDLDTWGDALRRHGVRALYYTSLDPAWLAAKYGSLEACPYLVRTGKGSTIHDFRPLPTPAYVDDMLTVLAADLSRHHAVVSACSLPDELDYVMGKTLRLIESPDLDPASRAKLAVIDGQIRESPGFGRYGILRAAAPAGEQALQRIATQRFLNDWVSGYNARFARAVRAIDPSIKVVSDDPQGQVFPYDYARRWKDADIVIHQAHDKMIPQEHASAVIVKFLRDVLGPKEIWPYLHTEGTDLGSLEDMREVHSRAFRGGATGVAFYNLTWGALRLGRWDNQAAPERWEYLRQIAAYYAAGNRAAIPETAKMGVYFSGYSAMADYARGMASTYWNLGAGVGSYFSYVDGFGVERGEIETTRHAVLFVTHASHERASTLRRILDGARRSGQTLVMTDQEAFSHDLDGSPCAGRDELLAGAGFGAKADYRHIELPGGLKMQVDKAREVLDSSGTGTVLMRYADGETACLSLPLGAGRVIWFGFNPFQNIVGLKLAPNMPTGFDYGDKAIEDPLLTAADRGSLAFFRQFLDSLGIPGGERLWSLQVPAYQPPAGAATPGLCLTGNAITWSHGLPRAWQNAPQLGRYRLSMPPSQGDQSQPGTWIPFASGRLTDRLHGLLDGRRNEDALDTWQKAGPVEIEIDLGYRSVIANLDLWAVGAVPAMTVATADDGLAWVSGSEAAATTTGDEVRRISLPVHRPARFLRLSISPRPAGQTLCLSEIEVWSGNR